MCDQSGWFPHARDGIIGLALVAEPSPLLSPKSYGPASRGRSCREFEALREIVRVAGRVVP